MAHYCKLLLGAALLPASLFAQAPADSTALSLQKELELNEVVVVARRPVMKQQEGKLVYLVRNDPYAKGLDGISLLGRIPRVSLNNGTVSVAGRGRIRYIIDGVLMELDPAAMSMRLRNLRAEDIEKIELLATPPSRYAVEPDAAYISITTRNETLGTRGSIYASLNQGDRLREYFSGSISHTTRRVELSLDASLSDYRALNDNLITYQLPDNLRRSSTSTRSRLLTSGLNALLKYKFSPDMKAGLIANYNYETSSATGHNATDYGTHTSTSTSLTHSRPNNALTLTGFLDWTFGPRKEALELTYNYFTRHSPTRSDIATTFSSDGADPLRVSETGATDYRFHSARADIQLPYPVARIEAGVAYTDILNSSDNDIRYNHAPAATAPDAFSYRERIAAAYLTASRPLVHELRARIGLRYEYTFTESRQAAPAPVSRDRYGRLFPTVNLSWSSPRLGSFNLSYSIGMGRPNLWELNPFRYYSTADEYSAGNPDLRPTLYHNAEINYYGAGGLYAVLYTSRATDAIGYLRLIDPDGTISTTPSNCLTTVKTGLYANYRRNLLDRCEIKLGGELFRSSTRSHIDAYRVPRLAHWSGKLEASANVMLNRPKTLIFSAQFTHFFPWQQNMISYRSFQLLSLTLRYTLLHSRLNLHLTANDLFGWNRTRSTQHYAGYTLRQTFDPHTTYVLLGVSYRFGRDKVSGVWRDPKETHSTRTK